MSRDIPIQGHCDPRFESVQKVFTQGFESGTEVGASVCFVLDGWLSDPAMSMSSSPNEI